MNKIQSLKTSRTLYRVMAIICGAVALFFEGKQMLPPLLLSFYLSHQADLYQIRLEIAEAREEAGL